MRKESRKHEEQRAYHQHYHLTLDSGVLEIDKCT